MGYFWLVFFIKIAQVHAATDKWRVWGPGIDGKATIPGRYFYAIIQDPNGVQIDARTLKKDDIKFELLAPSGKPVYCDKEFGFKYDGSIIFRYRLRFTLTKGAKIQIKHKNDIVFEEKTGPYLYDEACNCPSKLVDFYEEFSCPVEYRQLDKDMANFDKVDLDDLQEAGTTKRRWLNWGHGEATANVIIKNNELYIRDLGTIMGFRGFLESMLLSLLRKVRLPDVEFVFNLGDWPLEENLENPLPVFSWCGSQNTSDIALPTWEQTKTTRWALFRERTDIQYIDQISGELPPWEKKIEKGYFRGRDSNPARLDLCEMSVKNPEDFDARLTWNLHNKDGQDPKKYGPRVKKVPYTEMGKFKYQLLIDGTVAPYRTALLIMMDSVVFKQDSDYYEWWYTYLLPNVHYIPVKKDLSDLQEKIIWARNNDEKAHEIALNANAVVNQWMTPEHMYCYYAKAFELYSKKMSRKVMLTPKHEHVPQSKDRDLTGNWEKYWQKPSCKHCPKSRKDEL